MNETRNPSLKAFSQKLRREMTKEEKHLWYDFLKDLPVQFYRQKILGSYIVDFYSADAKLVIELDGSQHYTEEGISKDTERDRYLADLGLTVLRYSNLEIHRRFRDVCNDIFYHVFKDKWGDR